MEIAGIIIACIGGFMWLISAAFDNAIFNYVTLAVGVAGALLLGIPMNNGQHLMPWWNIIIDSVAFLVGGIAGYSLIQTTEDSDTGPKVVTKLGSGIFIYGGIFVYTLLIAINL